MTEIEFFNILMDKLNTLPESQLYEIVNYYRTYLSSNLSAKNNLDKTLLNLDNPEFIEKILIEQNKNNQVNHINSKINLEPINEPNSTHDINSNNTIRTDHARSINHKKNLNINILLKVSIIILSLIILVPILTTITAITFSICRLNIKIIFNTFSLALGYQLNPKILDLIPEFIFNFPKSSLFFFATGTSLLSLLLLFCVWYILKGLFIIIKTSLSKLNKQTKTEDL